MTHTRKNGKQNANTAKLLNLTNLSYQIIQKKLKTLTKLIWTCTINEIQQTHIQYLLIFFQN